MNESDLYWICDCGKILASATGRDELVNWRFNGSVWEHYHSYPSGHCPSRKMNSVEIRAYVMRDILKIPDSVEKISERVLFLANEYSRLIKIKEQSIDLVNSIKHSDQFQEEGIPSDIFVEFLELKRLIEQDD